MSTENQSMLKPEQQEALLAYARNEISRALLAQHGPETAAQTGPELKDLNDAVFQEKRAAFVTLTKRRALRGCIGSLVAVESLAASVRRNAVNAALHDPRFSPLTLQELEEVHIEISVLGPPQPLPYSDSKDLLQQLQSGLDGLILEAPGGRRATFLPQVWGQLPAAADFLAALCRKAGLATDAWKKDDISYQRYRVQSFTEQGGRQ